MLQDKFRVCGAKALRHIFLFNKAVLVAKRKADGILIVKAFIMVKPAFRRAVMQYFESALHGPRQSSLQFQQYYLPF
jgi:hypothetical protein